MPTIEYRIEACLNYSNLVLVFNANPKMTRKNGTIGADCHLVKFRTILIHHARMNQTEVWLTMILLTIIRNRLFYLIFQSQVGIVIEP